MSKSFDVQILTPDGPTYKGSVESVRLPGSEGQFEVLFNHARLMASLAAGPVVITEPGGHKVHLAVSGGFAEVGGNQVTVLAESAETAAAIDLARAEAARDRAKHRLSHREPGLDVVRAEAALNRAINRIRVARG